MKKFRKLKSQIPGEPLAVRYNWCQGPVPGRGPAVEKHWPSWSSICRPNHKNDFQSPTFLFKFHNKPTVLEIMSSLDD